jgi:hypothetical protein
MHCNASILVLPPPVSNRSHSVRCLPHEVQPSHSPYFTYSVVRLRCVVLCGAVRCSAVQCGLDRVRTERGGAHATPSPQATHVRSGAVLFWSAPAASGVDRRCWSDPVDLRSTHVRWRRRLREGTAGSAFTCASTVLLHAKNSHPGGGAEYSVRYQPTAVEDRRAKAGKPGWNRRSRE